MGLVGARRVAELPEHTETVRSVRAAGRLALNPSTGPWRLHQAGRDVGGGDKRLCPRRQ